MPKTLPPHIRFRPEHPGQKMLDILDAGHRLAFNEKLNRWEVWRYTWDSLGLRYDFITRLLADDRKGGYAEPGQWMVDRLRGRDSRYAGPKEAWKNVKAELDASEAKANAEKDAKIDQIMSEASGELAEHRLEWQLQSDPHYTGKRHTEWDKAPVPFFFSSNKKREAIREAGRAA